MKTTSELRNQERSARTRHLLAEMRGNSMRFRQAIAPDIDRTLVQRGEDGVHALGLAISYRDMARDTGKWAAR